MAQALEFFFDDDADRAVRTLWARLDQAGVPSLATRTHGRHRPHVTFALAGAIPAGARDALRTDLRRLAIPRLWLSTLGVFTPVENVLVLAAVVDTELLAVHSAVHDALAGRVRAPSAYYLPGSWVPHCTLAQGIEHPQVVAGFAALHPVEPIRATITEVAVVDTHTGAADPLLSLT
ncbi:MAG TPA: 2'-5' RNA ligase family protein [Actinophytocola sp.]|uniref:2'-5' RNA ligase family protein n=1 Tax=Actinophytocola sp. TaxID=1872138 RepID=UPI002DDD1206|nr:2'-5' RNA ligase family protein [Actinophytocola sp.]HEV2783266.1 2'-5' RNA ligase family protein [Actinophytocola sp.]